MVMSLLQLLMSLLCSDGLSHTDIAPITGATTSSYTKASFVTSNLTNATLVTSNLTNATFVTSNLTVATLATSNLTNATPAMSNRTNATVEEPRQTLPNRSLAGSPQPIITPTGLSGTAPLLNTTALCNTTADTTLATSNLTVATLATSNLTNATPAVSNRTNATVTATVAAATSDTETRDTETRGTMVLQPPPPPPPPPPPLPRPLPPPLRPPSPGSSWGEAALERGFRVDELVRRWGNPGLWFRAVVLMGARSLLLIGLCLFHLLAPVAASCVAAVMVGGMVVATGSCNAPCPFHLLQLSLLLCSLPGATAVATGTTQAIAVAGAAAAAVALPAIVGVSFRLAGHGKRKVSAGTTAPSKKKARASPKTKDASPGLLVDQQHVESGRPVLKVATTRRTTARHTAALLQVRLHFNL